MTREVDILEFLRRSGGRHRLKEIARALGVPLNNVKMPVRRLVRKGLILCLQRGVYCYRSCTRKDAAMVTRDVTFLAPQKVTKGNIENDPSGYPKGNKNATLKVKHLPCSKAKHGKDKVLEFLQKNVPNEYNASTLSTTLGLNYSSVRVWLSRLAKKGDVLSRHRGFYHAPIRAEDLKKLEYPTVMLHGIKLECNVPSLLQKWGEGISLLQAFTPAHLRHENIITTTLWFEMRRVTITCHRKGLVEIFCKTSDAPIDYPTFTRFVAFIAGVLHTLGTDLWKAQPKLRQIGLNCDYRYLRLDGISSVKLQTFRNAWAQIYQKTKDLVRLEEHLVTDISLAEAVTILGALQPVKVEYTKPKEEDVSYIG